MLKKENYMNLACLLHQRGNYMSTYANDANLNETASVDQSDAHHPRLLDPKIIYCIHEVTLNVFRIFFVFMVYSL